MTFAGIGDMAERMAGHGDHLEACGRRSQAHRIAIADSDIARVDARIVGRINHRTMSFAQRHHAADVIMMMVGEQDGPQLQLMLDQCPLYRFTLAGVHHQRVAVAVVQQPDVVVGQGR